MFRKRRPSSTKLLTSSTPLIKQVTSAVRGLLVVVVVALLLGACSGGENTEDGSGLIIKAEPTTYVFDHRTSENLAGRSTDPLKIQVGDCFNEYLYRDRTDFLQQITTVVDCDTPHDREAYAKTSYPAAEDTKYPTEDELSRWADDYCLDHFEDFIGMEYVLSLLDIGTLTPSFEDWTLDGNRTIICYVFPDEGGRLTESVANSEI